MNENRYRVAPLFLLRMAGVPFEHLEALATPRTAAAARRALGAEAALVVAKSSAEELLHRRDNELSAEAFHDLRAALRQQRPPAEPIDRKEADEYTKALAWFRDCAAELDRALDEELETARRALHTAAAGILPRYLVFGSRGVEELLAESAGESGAVVPRNKRARERERHLLLYLQRLAAKNDTFSEFGPFGWGTVARIPALELAPSAGVARREVFLERWAAHTIAAAINADPETRAELVPRLHPNGRLEADRWIFADSDSEQTLDAVTLENVARIDGRTPAHVLGISLENLAQLAAQNIICWEMEVPALEPHAVDVLVADISRWREGVVRTRWLETLAPLVALPRKFAAETDTAARAVIMKEACDRLRALGGERKASQRALYSALNPIGEECFRECGFVISEQLTDKFTRDAAPWIDLWRDTYAFVASRVAAGLRNFFASAPVRDGAVSLPAFLRHCENLKMPLTGHGLVALAHVAFQEVKAAFRQLTDTRADAAEWELSAEDCQFVRRQFEYPKFDEFTWPSADLQLAAESVAAVERGEGRWILGELHPPVALLHHGGYWGCPDHDLLGRAFASTTRGQPAFHFGFFAADFTAHTVVRFLDALPDSTSFVAPQRALDRWRTIAPADAEVYVDESTGDVAVRARSSREHLGSFARSWAIPLGFHPFHFARRPHTPRLRCGDVIVQRRCWTVALEELESGNFTGVSRALVLALEKLRAQKSWPRYIYIRPTEQALRRAGAEGRDKDTKPVFIDLESYLFLEIFHRWLVKSGELEVTEMLPAPHDLLWRENDGRRTFEMRTQIVPR